LQSNKKSGIISFDCKIIWVNKGENGMKKTKIVSIVLIVMIVIAMLFTARNVFAADDLGYLLGNNVAGNNVESSGGSSKPANSTPSNNSLNNTTNNLVLTTNNTSTYNNSSLPKTGVADSMPVAVLVVVLGISGVYAYKKMQEYKNI
jgi:hypothetical protein